jgi:hypothetical protein
MAPRALASFALSFLLVGCTGDGKTDTSVGDDDDDGATTDDDDSSAGDDDDDSSAGDDDDDDDDTPTGDTATTPTEPEPWVGRDCPDGQLATWHSGELVVFNVDPPATGTLDVPVGGLYSVYDVAVAESGPGQTNESAFFRVPNPLDPVGMPSPLGLTNCNGDYIVLDPDNTTPPPANGSQYLGTFWFEDGHNTIEMHHYCELYLQGQCTQFHDPNGTPCETGINSVHFTGTAVCLVPQ